MTQIMICLPPTGPWGIGQNNPVSPADLIKTAKECYAAGTSLMHMHARDLHGNLTTDMSYLQETFSGIQKESEMIIEASTGCSSNFTPEERGLPVSVLGATLGFLNLGSLNFGDEVRNHYLMCLAHDLLTTGSIVICSGQAARPPRGHIYKTNFAAQRSILKVVSMKL